MTIICAMHEPGVGTWIGSDRLRGGSRKVVMANPKFEICGEWAIGVSGTARAMDVLTLSKCALSACPDVQSLARMIRSALFDDGFVRDDKEGPAVCMNVGFIVASPTGLWDVDGSFAVTPIPSLQLHANGSGMDEAIGAAYAARTLGCNDGERVVRLAVEAAISNCQGCGGDPFIRLIAAE